MIIKNIFVTKLFFVFIFGIFTSMTVNASDSIDKSNPYNLMKNVSERLFVRLKKELVKINNDPNYLKIVVEEELMPYVNYRYASLKLLGAHLKKANTTRQDVELFIKSFRSYLVTSYAQILVLYTNQTIVFDNSTELNESQRIISVKLDIVEPPKPKIKLEFKLRKHSKTGEWAAFDMIAEGVSLLSAKQAEWGSKIRTQGIAALAKEIDGLAKNPITKRTN